MEHGEDDFSELNEVPRDDREAERLSGPEEGAPRQMTARKTEVYHRDIQIEPDLESRRTMEVRTIDIGALEDQLKRLGAENNQLKADIGQIAQRLHVVPRDRETMLNLLDKLIERGSMGSLLAEMPSPIRSIIEKAACRGYNKEELIRRWICEGAERLHTSGVLGQ